MNIPKMTHQEQIKRDEETVFMLAVLMMHVHTGTLLRNKNQIANAFMKVGVLLQNNPGFPARFKRAQDLVLAASGMPVDQPLVSPSGSPVASVVPPETEKSSD